MLGDDTREVVDSLVRQRSEKVLGLGADGLLADRESNVECEIVNVGHFEPQWLMSDADIEPALIVSVKRRSAGILAPAAAERCGSRAEHARGVEALCGCAADGEAAEPGRHYHSAKRDASEQGG
jgi:hypothetical protein